MCGLNFVRCNMSGSPANALELHEQRAFDPLFYFRLPCSYDISLVVLFYPHVHLGNPGLLQ